MKSGNPTRIAGMGACLPTKVLSNFDLEKMVDTTDEWIRTRTGIRERRIVENGSATSDLALQAGREAVRNAGLKPTDIDLVIVATITPDMSFPSTACIVQNKLGAHHAAAFDMAAACSGFPYALSVADGMIRGGAHRNILVIGAEVLSPFIDWTDRSTCILFGDGAGAAVVSESSAKARGLLATYLGSDGSAAEILKIPAGGSAMPPTQRTVAEKMHTVKMSGSELFKIAVRTMGDAVQEVCKRAGWKLEDVDCLIPHQANLRIIQAVAERLETPMEKIFLNLEKYGNMSAASTAVALYEAAKSGAVRPGSNVILVAFGGGLTWAACAIKW
ncbi:MAG: ketoacyl-ACP synthase III [Candidatus Omnitrophica bacterium]|nr:ketoacyl-ACP synthase III [Candidatus Omnitrophota bacterium]